MLIRSLVALSLTSAALLAGCGDDEPSAVVPTTPTTPAQAAAAVATAPTGAGLEDSPAVEEAKDEKKAKKRDKSNDPEWVVAVNARCEQYRKDSTEVLEKFQKTGVTSPDAAVKAMGQVMPLGQQLIKDLRPVDVPADVQEDWTSFLDTLNGAFDLMPQIAKTLGSGKPDPALMQKFAAIEKNTRPFADEYGLDECLAS